MLEKPAYLSVEEFNKVKQHTGRGFSMLGNIENFEEIALLISQHHEKLNGKGYPFF